MTINPRKKFLFLTTMILFFIGSSGYGQDSGLRVEIKPEQTTVKNGGDISVVTKIENTGREDQTLQIWSCSYWDNWMIDSPYIVLNTWPCNNNGVVEIVLKPKEKYENKLSLKINVPAEEIQVESVTFKLGFKTSVAFNNDESIKAPIVWSNPITIQIKE